MIQSITHTISLFMRLLGATIILSSSSGNRGTDSTTKAERRRTYSTWYDLQTTQYGHGHGHTHTQRDRRATEHSGLTSDCRPRHTLHVKIALNYFTDQSALHSCDSSPEPVCMYVNSCNNTAARGTLSRPESHVMFSQRQPIGILGIFDGGRN